MIGLKVDEAKRWFFDRDMVIGAVDEGRRKTLSKFGAFVMRDARNSIRSAKGPNAQRPSKPGTPPKSRLGLLKKFIFFVFSPRSESVIIGPAALNQLDRTAPRLLEHGGTGKTSWWLLARNPKASKTAVHPPRPYMQPAFVKNYRKLMPELWRRSVK